MNANAQLAVVVNENLDARECRLAAKNVADTTACGVQNANASNAFDIGNGKVDNGLDNARCKGHSIDIQFTHSRSPIWVSMKSVVASPAQKTSLSKTRLWNGMVV